jgi:hypothetical protein
MSNIKRMAVSGGLALVLAVALVATAVAGGRKDHKAAVCHVTGSDDYVEISVAMQAVSAHLGHGDVMADEYGDCP